MQEVKIKFVSGDRAVNNFMAGAAMNDGGFKYFGLVQTAVVTYKDGEIIDAARLMTLMFNFRQAALAMGTEVVYIRIIKAPLEDLTELFYVFNEKIKILSDGTSLTFLHDGLKNV